MIGLRFFLHIIGYLLPQITFLLAIECYDSSSPLARKTVECDSDMMCYSEYYAVNRSGVIRQYFDRFCIYSKHCIDRGITEECQSLEELDKGIQKTFFKHHHSKSTRSNLVHSKFCCCKDNKCNNFDHRKAFELFGIAVSEGSKSSHIPSLLFIITDLLFVIFLTSYFTYSTFIEI